MKSRIIAAVLAIVAIMSGVLQTACDREPAVVNTNVIMPASSDLMAGITAEEKEGKAPDGKFKDAMLGLSAEILRRSYAEDKGKNTLVSPLSIELALAMTANGAAGATLDGMKKVIGNGMSMEDLNSYLLGYVKSLQSTEKSKLSVADSIWFKDSETFRVVENFLKTNADYYGAQLYKVPFDDGTADAVNKWVDENTDGMIDKILDRVDPSAVMYLVNALAFEAEWAHKFYDYNINPADFTEYDGTVVETDMMYGTEYAYMSDGDTQGFLKYYDGYSYAFAAFLPEEGTDFDTYVESLTADKISGLLSDVRSEKTYISIPKFEFDYDTELSATLKALGMTDAFNVEKADFTGIGTSDDGNIYIGRVVHKTYILVDGLGTKAGAATMVEMLAGSAYIEEQPHQVYLTRPFVFAIVDCQTMLPVFIGTLTTVQ